MSAEAVKLGRYDPLHPLARAYCEIERVEGVKHHLCEYHDVLVIVQTEYKPLQHLEIKTVASPDLNHYNLTSFFNVN